MDNSGIEYWNCGGVPVMYRVNTPDYYFLSACVSFLRDSVEIFPYPDFFRNGGKISYEEFKELVKKTWESQSIEYSDAKLDRLIEDNKDFKSEGEA
jgi:hypothetical protein